jgi:toxin FitB
VSFIVLDTDVASTILRGRLADPLRSRLAGHSLCITFVTLGELTKWTVLRDWGPRRLASFESWRHQVVLLPFDEIVAVKWGEIQANAPAPRPSPPRQRQLDRRLLPSSRPAAGNLPQRTSRTSRNTTALP